MVNYSGIGTSYKQPAPSYNMTANLKNSAAGAVAPSDARGARGRAVALPGSSLSAMEEIHSGEHRAHGSGLQDAVLNIAAFHFGLALCSDLSRSH